MSSIPCMNVTYWITTSCFSSSGDVGCRFRTNPPLDPSGTITAFFTFWAFIEPEDLGAVVLPAVGPADPAARDHPAAEVDRLHERRVDEDLEQRMRLRHLRDRRPTAA